MRRDEAITRLKATEPALRSCGVGALYLFGSHARGDARPDSDVDVFIDPTRDEAFNFLHYMDAYEVIRKALGVDVGYSTRSGISPYVRKEIENEAIRIF